jgi:hypothetical protein
MSTGDAETIKINHAAFNDALQTIRDARVRSENNSPNFKSNILNETDAPSVVAYQELIGEMQSCLQKYNIALQADIDKFKAIASALDTADRACGTTMRERRWGSRA